MHFLRSSLTCIDSAYETHPGDMIVDRSSIIEHCHGIERTQLNGQTAAATLQILLILDAAHESDLNLESRLLLQAALEVRDYYRDTRHRVLLQTFFDTSALLSAIFLYPPKFILFIMCEHVY